MSLQQHDRRESALEYRRSLQLRSQGRDLVVPEPGIPLPQITDGAPHGTHRCPIKLQVGADSRLVVDRPLPGGFELKRGIYEVVGVAHRTTPEAARSPRCDRPGLGSSTCRCPTRGPSFRSAGLPDTRCSLCCHSFIDERWRQTGVYFLTFVNVFPGQPRVTLPPVRPPIHSWAARRRQICLIAVT